MGSPRCPYGSTHGESPRHRGITGEATVKLGLQLGYWGAQPSSNDAELVAAAEHAGYNAVFTAEAWGSDAYTPLAWWGRHTATLRLGTSVVQLPEDGLRTGRRQHHQAVPLRT